MMETLNGQYRIELEWMKQIQRDIQEIKSPTKAGKTISTKLKIDF